MSGRARGRARGRAQSVVADGDPKCPGGAKGVNGASNGTNGHASSAAPPRQPVGQVAMKSSGRATQRGQGKADIQPGGSNGSIAAHMKAMSLEDNRKSQMVARYGHSAPTVMKPDDLESTTGTQGTPVTLRTNYFALESGPEWTLYQYRIDFAPIIMSVKLRYGLLNQHTDVLGGVRCFDGDTIYLRKKLPDVVTELPYKLSRGDTGVITLQLTNTLPSRSPQCLHVYNVIFKKILKTIDMKLVGRNYYFPEQRVSIPRHSLEVWPGFTTSIQNYQAGVRLCCDVSSKVVHTNTVYDVMDDLYKNNSDVHSFQAACRNKLVGTVIITRYNNKTYTIDDIDFNETPAQVFEKKDGSSISVAEYMAQHYELYVNNMEQPMLISMPKDNDRRFKKESAPTSVLLIPELCYITGIPEELKKNFQAKKDIDQYTRLAPPARHGQIDKFLKTINQSEQCINELRGWGLSFANDVETVRGRMLDSEKIHMGFNRKIQYQAHSADWAQASRDMPMYISNKLTDWIMIAPTKNEHQAMELTNLLIKLANKMGMNIDSPHLIDGYRGDTKDFVRVLQDSLTEHTQLVLCILPNDRKDRYDAIKKTCCVEYAVPSQCVTARTLSKDRSLMSVATKIAIQMNCKLGGAPWALSIPFSQGFMVVGIDSYHNAGRKGGSVGAFIASTNKSCSQFYSKVVFQHNHGELVDGLRTCMQSALRHYHKVNQVLPDKILIYRDGVGDGQLDAVFNYELAELMKTFAQCSQEYKPNVSMVICKKRVNARFFAGDDVKHLCSPSPGSIIDVGVTTPEWFDFYLVSQAVRQGTVTPTHYNVILDNMKLGPDRIQKLTYKLTHMYYNWQGTVRVPAVCQYAHKLAFLVGQSLSDREPRAELCDKLFFL